MSLNEKIDKEDLFAFLRYLESNSKTNRPQSFNNLPHPDEARELKRAIEDDLYKNPAYQR